MPSLNAPLLHGAAARIECRALSRLNNPSPPLELLFLWLPLTLHASVEMGWPIGLADFSGYRINFVAWIGVGVWVRPPVLSLFTSGANDGRTFGRIRCGLIYLEASRTRIHQLLARSHEARRSGKRRDIAVVFVFSTRCNFSPPTRFHDEWLSDEH